MQNDISKLDLNGTGSCASFNFRRTARAVTQFYDAALQEAGLRSTQFAILVAIAKNQPVSISALARVLTIDQTTLTRSLRLLKKNGFIAISARSTMRQRFLTVRPKGRGALARSLPLWRKSHKEFVSKIGANYWTGLQSELERLAHVAVRLEESKKESAHAG